MQSDEPLYSPEDIIIFESSSSCLRKDYNAEFGNIKQVIYIWQKDIYNEALKFYNDEKGEGVLWRYPQLWEQMCFNFD